MSHADIAIRLREVRRARKITLAEVARRFGCTTRRIRHYESDAARPTAASLRRLADALEVGVGELLGLPPLWADQDVDLVCDAGGAIVQAVIRPRPPAPC